MELCGTFNQFDSVNCAVVLHLLNATGKLLLDMATGNCIWYSVGAFGCVQLKCSSNRNGQTLNFTTKYNLLIIILDKLTTCINNKKVLFRLLPANTWHCHNHISSKYYRDHQSVESNHSLSRYIWLASINERKHYSNQMKWHLGKLQINRSLLTLRYISNLFGIICTHIMNDISVYLLEMCCYALFNAILKSQLLYLNNSCFYS